METTVFEKPKGKKSDKERAMEAVRAYQRSKLDDSRGRSGPLRTLAREEEKNMANRLTNKAFPDPSDALQDPEWQNLIHEILKAKADREGIAGSLL